MDLGELRTGEAIDFIDLQGFLNSTLTSGSDIVGGPGGMNGSAGSNNTEGDDTIISGLSNAGGTVTNNLGTGDVIDGGGGTDILDVIDQNSTLVPNMMNVETISVQAVGTKGTTVNMVNTKGVTTIESDRSTDGAGLAFTNVQGEATLKSTGTGTNTTVTYAGGVNVGTDHTFVFNGQTGAGLLTVNGGNVAAVKTVNVQSTGAANSGQVTVTGATPTSLNVTGDQNLILDDAGSGNFNSLTKVDASGLMANFSLNLTTGGPNANAIEITGATGVDTLTLSTGNATVNSGTGNDVINSGAGGSNTINTGAGNDRVNMGGALDKNDKLDGGADTDTVSVTNLFNIDVVDAPMLTNFEILAFTGAATGILNVNGTGVSATTLPTSINTFNFEGGLGGNVSLTNLQDNVTVNMSGNPAGNNLTLDHATDTSTNVLNFGWKGAADQVLGTLTAPDAETINFNIDETAAGKGLTINTLNAPDLNGATVNVTGDGNLTIGDAAASGLTKVDASTSTGDINIAGIFGDVVNNGLQDAFKANSDITITTGGGADRVTGANTAGKSDTINTGAGNDVIVATTGADTMTLGDGKDVVGYSALNQSSGATIDTVTDFVSGTDQFDFSQLLGANATFVGNLATFGAAQGAVNNGGAVEAVFQQDTNTLWVDVNNDGTLNANDLQIKLTGVTTLAQADINGSTAFPNNVLLTAANANTVTGVNTLNNSKTSAANDIISSTDAFLNGSTVNGQGGNDILNVSTQATAANFNIATITNVDIINLAAGSTAINTNNVDGDLNTINANAAATVTIDANNNGITFNGSGGADTFNVGNNIFTGVLAGNGGTDTLIAGNASITGANGGAATSFETFSQVVPATTQMTLAQHNAFTTINGSGGTNIITVTTAGMLTGDADIETYNILGNSNFTVGASGQNVVETPLGGADATTVNIGSQVVTGNYTSFDTAGVDADTLVALGGANIAGANAGGALGFGTLNLTGSITMTAAQNQSFMGAGGVTAAGLADQITIAPGTYSLLTTDADVETYLLGDTTSNTINVTVNGAGQTISTFSANDVIDFQLAAAITNFTGTLNGGGTATDELTSAATTLNISGATLNSVEELNSTGTNAAITLTNAQLNGFTGAVVTTGANNTATITDAATIVVDNTTVLDRPDFENLILSNASDDIRFNMQNTDSTVNSVNIASGGADDIRLNNVAIQTATTDHVVITGFTVGNDDLDLEVGGVNIAGAIGFGTVAAGSNTNVAIPANGVIEIAGAASISAATATDTSNGGNVELAIAAAVGTVTNAGNYGVVLYDGTNAYVYTANLAGAADAGTGNMTVELVAQVNNIGLGTLTAGDFI